MKDLNKHIGEVIRKIRREQGLTQEDLAEASGIHDKYIGRIERGLHGVTLEFLYKLAAGLGTTPPDLVKAIFEMEKENEGKEKLVQNMFSFLQTQSVENLKILQRLVIQFKDIECLTKKAGTHKEKKTKKK